jgi:hypothetical protein
MSRIDQNSVNLGPAKIKTEDAIYDSVDQGVVGATTTSPVVVPPPTVIPLPTASLELSSGYPITVNDLGLTDLNLNGRPRISGSRWVIGDLTASGYYSRTLVCDIINEEIQQKLYFFNLDDVSQNVIHPYAGFLSDDSDYVIRDGILTRGIYSFIDDIWTTPQNEFGGNLYNDPISTVSDATYVYGFIDNYDDDIYKYPHVGTFSVSPVTNYYNSSPYYNNWPVNNDTLRCVAGNVLWFYDESLPDANKTLTVINNNGLVNTYNLYPNIPYVISGQSFLENRNSFFGLNNGSICYLQQVISGPYYIYHLHTMNTSGNLTTIVNFITIRSSTGLQTFIKTPDKECMFALTSESPKRVFKITSFNCQEIEGLPTTINGASWNAQTGNLRFLGANPADPEVAILVGDRKLALYEYML